MALLSSDFDRGENTANQFGEENADMWVNAADILHSIFSPIQIQIMDARMA